MALPSVVIHAELLTLFVMVQPAGAFAGVLRTIGNALKSPLISAAVGRFLVAAFANRRILFHSSPAKKKSLPRLIGPPKSHPKSLNRSGPFTAPGVGSLASKTLFRINSKRNPWKLAHPPPLTTFTQAPQFP